MKEILVGLVLILIVVGLGWFLQANNLAQQSVFAPKYEQVRHDTFKNSQSYNDGMVQELQNMRFEYIKASPSQQVALKGIILHRAANYPVDRLPTDLRYFIEDLSK